MTTPLDQTERERFEAWWRTRMNASPAWRPSRYELPDHRLDGLYISDDARVAWEAWQAATASRAVPETPAMPETWHVVAYVHGEPILSIGYDWLAGKELDEAEEQAVIGMAKHLLAFVGYGLPPSDFALDDGTPPIAAKAAKETT